MEERHITENAGDVYSNYFFCPSLCHECIYFEKINRSEMIKYRCNFNSYPVRSSAKLAANRYQKETYMKQFEDCEAYKNRVQIEQDRLLNEQRKRDEEERNYAEKEVYEQRRGKQKEAYEERRQAEKERVLKHMNIVIIYSMEYGIKQKRMEKKTI